MHKYLQFVTDFTDFSHFRVKYGHRNMSKVKLIFENYFHFAAIYNQSDSALRSAPLIFKQKHHNLHGQNSKKPHIIFVFFVKLDLNLIQFNSIEATFKETTKNPLRQDYFKTTVRILQYFVNASSMLL